MFHSWFDEAPLLLAPEVKMTLSAKDTFHGEIALRGIYEAEESLAISRLASEVGGLLVDVGANYGYYSLLWCATGVENRAVAVEASPLNIKALRVNVASNAMTDRITVAAWAASNRDGQGSFDFGSREQTGWGGLASVANEKSVPVYCRRLDDVIDEPICVLKVDCEGADALVLEGAEKLLAAGRVAHVFFEENLGRQQPLGINAGQSAELLRKHGYTVEAIGGDYQLCNFHAYR